MNLHFASADRQRMGLHRCANSRDFGALHHLDECELFPMHRREVKRTLDDAGVACYALIRP
jgi:hypothetical protein